MTPLEQRKKTLSAGIFSLFYVWLITAVALDAVLVLGIVVSKQWLPFVVVGLLMVVMVLTKGPLSHRSPICFRIPSLATATLAISALIMFLIVTFGQTWEPNWVKPQPFSYKIPYVSALIVYPTAFVVAVWSIAVAMGSRACVNCRIQNGSYTERGLIAKLFKQESTFQLRFMAIMSAVIAIEAWAYYFARYINVNYNRADLFYFVLLPSAITVLSIIYFYMRYYSMWRHYCLNPAMEAVHGNSTAMRYIVIVGDHILLDPNNPVIVDTPFKTFLPFTTEVSPTRARDVFHTVAGIYPQRIERAYESEETTTLANSFHYLCYFDSVNQLRGAKVPAQLYTYRRVVDMLRQGKLAAELRSELERIYTVAMAWKTYTPEGRRIYPVKNYRPSFRFRDIESYHVDYNDRRWLAVTVNNEDKPFYRLRRIWDRYVNGR